MQVGGVGGLDEVLGPGAAIGDDQHQLDGRGLARGIGHPGSEAVILVSGDVDRQLHRRAENGVLRLDLEETLGRDILRHIEPKPERLSDVIDVELLAIQPSVTAGSTVEDGDVQLASLVHERRTGVVADVLEAAVVTAVAGVVAGAGRARQER